MKPFGLDLVLLKRAEYLTEAIDVFNEHKSLQALCVLVMQINYFIYKIWLGITVSYLVRL